jgi:phage shock protein C
MARDLLGYMRKDKLMDTRVLRRSRTNRRIAGVCGGLAAYFGISPTLVRLLFVLLALPGGVPGILIYLVLWFAIPEEPAMV